MDRIGLRDIESTLPPGFRFYPSDEELVCHYLFKKAINESTSEGTMVEVDLHTREPWELPEVAKLNAEEWYFFSFRDRKYATGTRANRATRSGYWKATGKDKPVSAPGTWDGVAGMRKTLVFYRGRAPHGFKTAWVMHEFRLHAPHSPPVEEWVLCRVFHKRKGNGSTSPGASSSLVGLPMNGVERRHEQLRSCSQLQEWKEVDNDSSAPRVSPFLSMDPLLQLNPQDMEMMTMSSERSGEDELGFLLLDVGFGQQPQQQRGIGEGMGSEAAAALDPSCGTQADISIEDSVDFTVYH